MTEAPEPFWMIAGIGQGVPSMKHDTAEGRAALRCALLDAAALIARRDGYPILRPQPTHGNPKSEAVKSGLLKPWRTAAEIIDWHLPCPSIFLTRNEAKTQGLRVVRPLAAKTLSRIARGFKRYVLNRADPFIVAIAHGDSGGRREYSIHEPHGTVTSAGQDRALITPFVSYAQQGGASRSAKDPLHTVCGIASTKAKPIVMAPKEAADAWHERHPQMTTEVKA